MQDIVLTFDTGHNRYLGETGENLAARLVIDVKPVGADWSALHYALLVMRPTDPAPYIAAPALYPDGQGFIAYPVTNTETAFPGRVSLEVQALDGDRLVKNVQVVLRVEQSLGGYCPAGRTKDCTTGQRNAILVFIRVNY